MSTKKTALKDIRHGEMNALEAPSTQPRFDPSRAQVVDVMRNNISNHYTANTIKGKRRWNAIVLKSTQQKYAHVASEFQRTYTSYERGNSDGEFTHFTYKIFIAELDSFKKLPEDFRNSGPSAGLLNLCRDAISPLGKSWGKIDYGTPVEVVFEDQERLRTPIITDVHSNRRIALKGEKSAQGLFLTSPRIARESAGGSATVGSRTVTDCNETDFGALKNVDTWPKRWRSKWRAMEKASRATRMDTAYNYFINKDYSAAASAGIVGGLIQESSVSPDACNKTDKDYCVAYGIAQWTSERQKRLKEKYPNTYNTLNSQLDWLYYELSQGREQKAGRLLSAATTLGEAVYGAANFERFSGYKSGQQGIYTNCPDFGRGHEWGGRAYYSVGVYERHNSSAGV
jgi:hypothetical protein